MFPDVQNFIGRVYKDKHIGSVTDLAGIFLEEAKVAVVPGAAFGDERCFRLSYAVSMENIKEGLDRIQQVLSRIT